MQQPLFKLIIFELLYPEVLKQALETYHIESTKMMRYARQRGKEDKLKKILEEIEDAEA